MFTQTDPPTLSSGPLAIEAASFHPPNPKWDPFLAARHCPNRAIRSVRPSGVGLGRLRHPGIENRFFFDIFGHGIKNRFSIDSDSQISGSRPSASPAVISDDRCVFRSAISERSVPLSLSLSLLAATHRSCHNRG